MIDHLGPYELRGELGRGAMAVVWLGYDPKLEREVAIKEPMFPALVSEAVRSELLERFVREGRVAAGLNHPGIVTIHAADVWDGRPAIVMERIDGETLASLLQHGSLPVANAVAILDQLLDAVAYAHQRGVVHRDIKPENVFVTGDGRVRLTDFGIAHVGGGATLTQAGAVMGTPGYMAPEQVTGAPVDARTDIFAIGAIGYEMLSGHNPFGATDGIAPTTVMYRIVHEAPPPLPLSAAGPSGPLAAFVMKSMSKDPNLRYSSAREMRDALHLAAQDEVGSRTGALELSDMSPRSRAGVWATLAVAGVLLVGAFIMFGLGASSGGAGGRVGASSASSSSGGAISQSETTSGPPAPSADQVAPAAPVIQPEVACLDDSGKLVLYTLDADGSSASKSDVAFEGSGANPSFVWTRDGSRLVVLTAGDESDGTNQQLLSYDDKGNGTPIAASLTIKPYSRIRRGPGNDVLLTSRRGDVTELSVDGTVVRKFTADMGPVGGPDSPAGNSACEGVEASPKGPTTVSLYAVQMTNCFIADSSARRPKQLDYPADQPDYAIGGTWSPDGSRILTILEYKLSGRTKWDVHTFTAVGRSDMSVFSRSVQPEDSWIRAADWAQAGKAVVFDTVRSNPNDPSGNSTIGETWYVRSDGSGARKIISGASSPAWRP